MFVECSRYVVTINCTTYVSPQNFRAVSMSVRLLKNSRTSRTEFEILKFQLSSLRAQKPGFKAGNYPKLDDKKFYFQDFQPSNSNALSTSTRSRCTRATR